MKRLDILLAPLIKNFDLEDGARLSRLKKNWYNIFHPPLVSHIYPLNFSEGELLINVDSPAWMQELKFFRNEIISKLDSYGVKSIRFRIGRVQATTYNKNSKIFKKENKKLSDEEIIYIENTISQITEKELREKIRTAIEKAVSSGKTRI
ncbi:MAG: DUF721 domain-containing protein [Nitrospirae bacterium]|nr:DUF721 domain-containing protein [Nitrospirota bacterium]